MPTIKSPAVSLAWMCGIRRELALCPLQSDFSIVKQIAAKALIRDNFGSVNQFLRGTAGIGCSDDVGDEQTLFRFEDDPPNIDQMIAVIGLVD